jgi:hypothetical protein
VAETAALVLSTSQGLITHLQTEMSSFWVSTSFLNWTTQFFTFMFVTGFHQVTNFFAFKYFNFIDLFLSH